MITFSFPPISNIESKVLILGTMPGIASLKLNQYYGHTRNNFWKLLFEIFNEPFSTDYEIRKKMLLKNNVALWDVIKVCVREGSLDCDIKQEIANDFNNFLNEYPNIDTIVFNGKKAAKFYQKYVMVSKAIQYIT